MEPLKIGIVGYGNMGSAHAACIAAGKIKGMRLYAVCDNDPAKLEKVRTAYGGLRLFKEYREMLRSGIDAVIIATPHYLHPVIAEDAFAQGIHVMTEKPAGVSVSAVRRMNEAAERSGKVFAIMFNQRTEPLFEKARQLVQNGELGVPKRFTWIITNWYRTQFYYDSGAWRATWAGEGGGVLLNQAPHNLDVWQWIFGMPSKLFAVCSEGKYHNIEVEDEAVITAEYENGSTAQIITTTGESPGTNRLEIVGDRKKLVLENGVMKIWSLKEPERAFCFNCKNSFAHIDTDYEEITSDKKFSGHEKMLQNFADAVLTGSELIAPGYEGIRSLLISNAAYLSAWTGKPVGIPFCEEEFDRLLEDRCRNSRYRERTSSGDEISGKYSERWQVRW